TARLSSPTRSLAMAEPGPPLPPWRLPLSRAACELGMLCVCSARSAVRAERCVTYTPQPTASRATATLAVVMMLRESAMERCAAESPVEYRTQVRQIGNDSPRTAAHVG